MKHSHFKKILTPREYRAYCKDDWPTFWGEVRRRLLEETIPVQHDLIAIANFLGSRHWLRQETHLSNALIDRLAGEL